MSALGAFARRRAVQIDVYFTLLHEISEVAYTSVLCVCVFVYLAIIR